MTDLNQCDENTPRNRIHKESMKNHVGAAQEHVKQSSHTNASALTFWIVSCPTRTLQTERLWPKRQRRDPEHGKRSLVSMQFVSIEYPSEICKHWPLALYLEICCMHRPSLVREKLLNKIRIEHEWHCLQFEGVAYIYRGPEDNKWVYGARDSSQGQTERVTLEKTWVFWDIPWFMYIVLRNLTIDPGNHQFCPTNQQMNSSPYTRNGMRTKEDPTCEKGMDPWVTFQQERWC